jgi:hypothetical protein
LFGLRNLGKRARLKIPRRNQVRPGQATVSPGKGLIYLDGLLKVSFGDGGILGAKFAQMP